MGYGVLAKGPVAIALPAIATLAVAPVVWPTDRPWRRVLRDGALAGLTTLAVAVPWYAEMSLRYGDAFLDEALWRHNVGRFVGTSYAHEKPVWYFVLPTLLLLVPWTAFLPAAVKSALSKRREPRNVLRLLMASAGITAFLFYSLSASKLPNYAFVIVPPLAIVIAMHLDDRLSVAAPGRTAFHVTGFLLLAVALALLAVPWTVGTVFKAREIVGGAPGSSADLFWLFGRAAWPSAAVLGIGGLLSFVGTPTRRLIALGLVGAVWPLALFIGAQPLLALSYPWAHFGQELAGTSGQVWLIGPRAPSLTFYAGRSVARVDPSQHDTNLRLESDGWIVADSAWLAEHAGHSDFDRVSVDVVDECGTMSLARLHAR